MDSTILFIIIVVAIALVAALAAFKTPAKAVAYFKTKDGRGVLTGVVLFILAGILLAGLSLFSSDAEASEPTWFTYSEVFLGLDHTKNLSPQCEKGGPNDRLTSNGGLRQNVYRSTDDRFHLNAKYTHHSCAFSPDRESYDAIGLEATFRFFQR